MRRRSARAAVPAVFLLLAGCTAHPQARPSPTAPAASASAPAPRGRTFTAGRGDVFTALDPTLARAGTTVVLTLPLRLDRTAIQGRTAITSYFSRTLALEADAPLLIDEAAGRVYQPAVNGDSCTCTGAVNMAAGETTPIQAAYTGIPDTVARLSVQVPPAGVFLDVPVTTGAAGPLDVSDPGESVGRDLTELVESPDVLTTKTPRQVDLNLSADVLFKVDKATLTPAATKAITAAVTELKTYAPGPLTITGHTDDTGTDAHNQTLSEARAKTVASALEGALPPAQWPRTVSGKGEKQPVADNATAGGRQLNRRVTITYRTAATAPAASAAPPATEPLPATKGIVGTAAAGVEVAVRNGTVRFTAGPAQRRGDRLLVTLVVHNSSSQYLSVFDYLSGGFWRRHGLNQGHNPYDDSGVRLLDGAKSSWPLDYEVEKLVHSCLCDPDLAGDLAAGADRTLPLWFPAPPAGVTTTTLDVPDKFRLTDVPIR